MKVINISNKQGKYCIELVGGGSRTGDCSANYSVYQFGNPKGPMEICRFEIRSGEEIIDEFWMASDHFVPLVEAVTGSAIR